MKRILFPIISLFAAAAAFAATIDTAWTTATTFSEFRADIATNFTNLNTDKLESGDIASIAALEALVTADIVIAGDLSAYLTTATAAATYQPIGSYLLNVVEDTTPALGGPLDGGGNNITNLGDITFRTGASGGTIQTGTSNADKYQLQAYDVDGAAYVTLMEADAGNVPYLQMFTDTLFLENRADPTKQVQFDLSGLSTATVVTLTSPTTSGTISLVGHTQTASTITDFDTAVAANSAVAANTAKVSYTDAAAVAANTAKVSYTDAAAVAANTAKVTNATHTGDVTGSTALTIAAGAVDIAMLSATGTKDATTFLRGDNTFAAPPGGGGGDAISIDAVGVVDPNFASTGDIDFVDTANVVTANINVGAVGDAEIDYTAVTLADLTFDVGSVTTTEYGYLDGVTSAIQTQLDARLDATDLGFYADASAFAPRTTAGAEAATEEYATNDVMSDHYLFDSITEEGIQLTFVYVAGMDSTITVTVYWDAASGATAADGVTWGVAAQSFANDDPLDTVFSTSVDTDDVVIAVGDLHTITSAAVTISGTPATGDLVVLEITRVVADAQDDMAEDAKFLGAFINP